MKMGKTAIYVGTLFLGVWCCSISGIFIKLSHLPFEWLSALRLLIGAAVLAPLWFSASRIHAREVRPTARSAMVPGLLLALHFLTWIYAVRLTPVAHSALIVNLSPVFMPFFSAFMIRERVRPGEWAGVALALLGAVVLASADIHVARDQWIGDAVCFASMLLFTTYLALGRANRTASSPWLYVVPLYAMAGLACLPFAAFVPITPTVPFTWGREMALLLGLVLIPTVLGHSSLMIAMRGLSAQTVSLVNLLQFSVTAIWGYFILSEVPSPPFYPAAGLMLAGAVCAILSSTRRKGGSA